MYTKQQIADALDYAVLVPTTKERDIRWACDLVNEHGIRTICVAPIYAPLARSLTERVCAVVGYPHGTTKPSTKRDEALMLMDEGVQELDVVINYGRLLDGDDETVRRELTAIIDATRPRHVIVKAILESCYYTPEELDWGSRVCIECGVDFLKTSSGAGLHGATKQAVQIMLAAAKDSDVLVKASGGIKCYDDAAKFLDLGCARLGASRFKELLP